MPQERQEKRIDQLTHLTTVPDDAKIPAEYNGVAYYVEAEDIKGRTETELTTDIKNALLTIAQKVAYIDQNGQTYYNALYNALYPPTSLVSISAVFTQGNNTVYDTDTLDSLKQYLTVTALYDDQTTATVTNYTLSGTLTAGTSTITVSYGGKTTMFTVTVTHRVWAVTSISAVFNQGSAVIYDNASLDSLRQYLTVTATYENSSTGVVTDYTLSGTLTVGTSTITATYSGKSDTFNVTVTEAIATLTSITAVFTQGQNVIYDTDSLDTLKQYLVVTAHYDDNTDTVVSNYTLSGTLTEGTSTITVSFGGKTTSFTVSVTHYAATPSLNWDFTQSLIDTVNGKTATIGSKVSQESDGLHFNGIGNAAVKLGSEKINMTDKTVIIKVVASPSIAPSTQHARLFALCSTNGTANTGASAFLWRYNNNIGWTLYLGTAWNNESLDPTAYPIDFFTNKKIKLYFDSDRKVTLSYADMNSEQYTTITTFSAAINASYINRFPCMGSNQGDELTGFTVGGVSIYEGAVI